MPDVVPPEVRSRMMSGIRGKNTKPELILRQGLHRRGLRFRLHDSRLPGRPDLVFRGREAVVFVNGCFWHGHDGCPYFKIPQTRPEFWSEKIRRNKERDRAAITVLESAGWRVAVIWECATRRQPERSIDALEAWIRGNGLKLELNG
jgi:DNA mismatch endonuclease (patch repair protein)